MNQCVVTSVYLTHHLNDVSDYNFDLRTAEGICVTVYFFI